MKRFKKIVSSNPDVQALSDNVNDALTELELVPYLDGVMLESISLTTTSQPFAHGLNRIATRARVEDTTASSSGGQLVRQANRGDAKKYVWLSVTSGTATMSVWIS